MKTFVLALIAAVLVAAQVLSPAAAAAPAAAACGDTYTVQRGDYLSKIAKTCGVTLTTLINANPEIKNTNLIYPGQVIRIKNDSSIPVTGGTTYVVQRGDTLFKIAVRFGTTVDTLLRLNPSITNRSLIYTGQVIRLPGDGTTIPVTGRSVTVNDTTVRDNQEITVTVRGFPANAEIDFRLGEQGQAYSVVADGKTNASGGATATMTIPSAANTNEKWVVVVTTTSLASGVEVTSPVMTIVP